MIDIKISQIFRFCKDNNYLPSYCYCYPQNIVNNIIVGYNNVQGIYNGKQYDVVIGAVADDTIYRVFSLYEAGLLDREETLKRLKIRKFYDQVNFCTEKALICLHYIGQLDFDTEEDL